MPDAGPGTLHIERRKVGPARGIFEQDQQFAIAEWLGVAWAGSFGQGCPGSSGTPRLLIDGNDLPRVGRTWNLRLQGLTAAPSSLVMFLFGLSNTTAQVGSLPFPLASFGMPGCSLYVSPDVTMSQFAQSAATAGIAIPNGSWLLGMHLFAQGSAFEPGVNAAGLVMSEGADGRIGI